MEGGEGPGERSGERQQCKTKENKRKSQEREKKQKKNKRNTRLLLWLLWVWSPSPRPPPLRTAQPDRSPPDRRKIRPFFPSPATISFFSSLSGFLLVECWWCLDRRDPEMCTLGVLGLSCETPAAPKREGSGEGSHPQDPQEGMVRGGPGRG